jgi:hypothetical protein
VGPHQVIEEAAARRLADVEHAFEAAGAAVIGVGHVFAVAGGELEEQAQLVRATFARERRQVAVIGPVHGEDEVEFEKVFGPRLARAEVADLDPPLRRRAAGARVRAVTDMVVAGTGGIACDGVVEPRLTHKGIEHALGGGRAADVSHADEQDTNHGGLQYFVCQDDGSPQPV